MKPASPRTPESSALPGLEAALRRYFRKRADIHEVDDLVQEVFVRLHARRAETEIDSFERYVFAIAGNLLKHRARRGGLPARPLSNEDDPAFELTPERIVISQDRLKRVLDAIGDLPVRTREIFVLHRFEEITYQSIANRLGISVSAVEKHIIAALRVLKATTDHEP